MECRHIYSFNFTICSKYVYGHFYLCIHSGLFLQGFAIPKDKQGFVAGFSFDGKPEELRHGDVVIAAITSCTNTSNPSVMLGAGLVAKKAFELGLKVCHFSHFAFFVLFI